MELPGNASGSEEQAVGSVTTPEAEPPPPAGRAEITTSGLAAALDRLVDRNVINRGQADAVVRECEGGPQPARPDGRGHRLGEIAGYLGASLVVGATLLFLGEKWDALGRPGRVTVLAVMAALLFSSGVAVRRRTTAPGERWWRPQAGDSVRRRLSSTLLTGSAVAVGFAAYAGLEPARPAALVASIAALGVAVVGYLLARGAVGQLGAAVAAFAVYASLLDLLGVDEPDGWGFGMLALGASWVVLGWRRIVAEPRFALAIAVTFGLAGAQLVVVGDGDARNYLGYALTALVAAACFAAYAKNREWIVLVGGVAGASLVVPEFLYDVTDGSLGASGVMLVAGVTLLAGSLIGLRIRRTPEPDAAPPGPVTT